MSRKRVASIKLFSNGIFPTSTEIYQYEYYSPGCYYIPQVVRQVTPYNYTYLDHWQPCCTTATYVVDRFGRANYPSDLEFQVPASHPQPREVMYNYYDDDEAEIALLPQIDEDDFTEEDVTVPKRKRLNNGNEFRNEIIPVLKKSYSGDFGNSLYRSNEGYLVEEPNDNVQESA